MDTEVEEVPDCRVQGRTVYPLSEVILMLFLATLAGSESCLSTHDFWMSNAKLYRRLFSKETIPSHDTFRRVPAIIRADEFNALLVSVLRNSDTAIRKALNLPKCYRERGGRDPLLPYQPEGHH